MEVGSILAGRYRVGDTIGRGGMGVVVKAVHLQLGTPVAIKVLRREAVEEPDLVARFLREARSAARLRGEHVCRVTDFGTTDDGTPFMVMEYLEGEDLKSVVDRGGPLDPKQAAAYVLQACIGVAEAHALGIVHRDLKPGNLFVVKQPDGRRSIKLLDFGIAKSRSATIDGSLTNTAKAMGSPAYMSPEQLKASTTADARSDVWSLGVTLYELVTEQRPFDGDTPYELAITIANDAPAALPDTVPPELARVIMRCLEKDPDRRYPDVGKLAAALAPLVKNGRELAAQAQAALQPEAASDAPRPVSAVSSPATETTLRGASGAVAAIPARSRLRFVLPVALAAVAVVATIGVMTWSADRDADDESPAAPPAAAPVVVPPDPPDAALATAPDAAHDPAVTTDASLGEPLDALAPAAPVDAAEASEPRPKQRKKRRTRPRRNQDFGTSRY